MDAFLLALFAWALGLLGHRPIELIREHYRRKAFRRGLIAEFDEVRLKLAYNVFLASSRQHTVNRELLLWMQGILGTYRGIRRDRGIEDMVTSLSVLTDDQLRALPGDEPGRSLTFRKYVIAFTASILPSLSLFPDAVQRRIGDVCAALEQLNEEIERTWFWHTKTFDASLSEANHRIVRNSVEQTIQEVGRIARDLASRMGQVMQYCETGKPESLEDERAG